VPAHNGSPVANNRSDPVDEDQDAGKMPAPGNAALVRQAIEQIWNQGNLDVADTLFTAAYVNVGGLVPDLVRGPGAIKIAASLHHTAFPRLHVTIERMISEGAIVAFQWVARNDAVGDGIVAHPSASPGALRGTTFCRLISGKIVESWTNWDSSGVLRKLVRTAGFGPAPEARPPSGLN
jgi:hypothetical protein